MNNAHILGTERIGKLLVQYSIPAIIGMTITERPGRSNGSIGKHTDVLPGQRIHIRQCFIHLSG